ncbi:unnamed protein product [Sphagnum troendelagicum]|uniref:Uncharacterized protein n=1 Tax=Sphagnum troendelagicum TaxID=128251 RepID=A0ABP0US43_9BRYO
MVRVFAPIPKVKRSNLMGGVVSVVIFLPESLKSLIVLGRSAPVCNKYLLPVYRRDCRLGIRSGAGDNGETGESFYVQEARAAVAAALVDAGLEEEDAIHVSENAPVFLQKLVDQMGNEAAEGIEIAYGEGGVFKSGFEVQALSRRQQWRAVLESVGVREQHVDRVSHSLSTLPLPDFFKKVRYLEEILTCIDYKGQRLEGKIRLMMMRLSVPADEDLQRALSFFEKMEACREGLSALNSAANAVARVIEDFWQIFLCNLESELKPRIEYLETLGVPKESVGQVLLGFPPVLLSDIEKDLKPRLRTLKKVGVRARDLGRMVVRYPWLLSQSVQTNVDDTVTFLNSIKVPGGEVDRAITRCPQLVGSSATRTMQPVVHCLNTLGVKSKRLGRVIARSPQLLLHTPRELNEVVEFLEELGVERSDMGGMLRRSPELFASNVKLTLQRKVEFLENLGVRKEHVWRVLRAYPEMLSLSVEDALQPRMNYLQRRGLSRKEVVLMVGRFPPILGYTIDAVLKPKLDFLVEKMGRSVDEVVAYPRFFSYSLEKKIAPRARVIANRGISCDLQSMLAKNNDQFAYEFLGVGRLLIPP